MPRGQLYTESAAMNFSGATGGINCGSATSLDDTASSVVTYLAWIYPQGTTGLNGGIFGKGTSGSNNRLSMEIRSAGSNMALYCIRDRATTDSTCESVADTIKGYLWQCIAGVWDGTYFRAYWGTQTQPIQEVAYSSAPNGTGSGNPGDNSANTQYIGAYGAGTSGMPNASIAVAAKFHVALTPLELMQWQYSVLNEPLPAVMRGCVGLWYPGFDGANTIIDYSGNYNTGTNNGATVTKTSGLVLPTTLAMEHKWLGRSLQNVVRIGLSAPPTLPGIGDTKIVVRHRSV